MRIGLLATASIAVIAGTSGAAFAQEAADDKGIQEIIVTAQKRSENLQTVPISVSAVTAESLARTGASTLEAVQRLTPGLTMSAVGSGFVSYTYIRGAGTNVVDSGADPSVATFVDEFYQAGNAGLQFDLLDIERVEVLKGPQGTLFGRNAAAGAISITTRAPEDSFDAYIQADGGNYDYFSLRGGITGPISEGSPLSYRLSIGHRERGAFTENPAGRDPGTINTYSGRAALQYDGADVKVRLSSDWFKSDNGMTNAFLATANPLGNITAAAFALLPADQSFYRHYYNVNGFERQRSNSEIGRIEWDMGGVTLTSISGYRNVTFKRLQDQDGSLADGSSLGSDVRDTTFSQEVRLSNSGDRLHWIGGLYFYSNKTRRTDTLAIGPDHANAALRNSVGTYTQHLDTTSYAAFGQIGYDLTDELTITLGGRYTKDKKDSRQTIDPAGPVGLFTVNIHPEWESFDPTATIEYQASPTFLLYGSYRQGFKSGGFQSLPSNATLAGTPYNPEHVKAFEFGVKSQWFDRRLTINVAGFHTIMQDQQLSRAPGPGVLLIDNAGRTKTEGFDVNITARPVPNWTIYWSNTLQRAKFTNYVSNGTSFAGNRQLRSPDYSTSVSSDFDIPIGNSKITLHGEYYYQSKAFFDAANTATANAFQPGYGIVNARLIFAPDDSRWDVSIWGKNLTDKQYFRNVNIIGPTGTATPGDPLTFGVSFNWRLN